jgi:hypothetical protein
MGQFQPTRNIEASLVDYLQTEIDKSWSNISVIVGFEEAYSEAMPIVAVFAQNTNYDPIEIGNTTLQRNVLINVNIFATGEGQRLDLKDYIVKELYSGCPYYKYTISNGSIESKTEYGNMTFLNISDRPINADNLASQDAHDRHRHEITFNVELSKIEE